MANTTLYDQVGGAETFRRLTTAFYRRVKDDSLLWPMYPSSVEHAAETLGLFLGQYFGGPQDYSALHGHPRLRMRHMTFHVGQAERDAWLSHMLAAIDEVRIAEPARSVMRQYFEQTSEFLINSR